MSKKVRLTKLSDDYFEGNHPNGINEGYVKEGMMLSEPKIGERFYLATGTGFITSTVIEALNEEGIFKTMYSTYKLEVI